MLPSGSGEEKGTSLRGFLGRGTAGRAVKKPSFVSMGKKTGRTQRKGSPETLQ